nr:hypothetical protein CFP56_37315 [Quercus suber]
MPVRTLSVRRERLDVRLSGDASARCHHDRSPCDPRSSLIVVVSTRQKAWPRHASLASTGWRRWRMRSTCQTHVTGGTTRSTSSRAPHNSDAVKKREYSVYRLY